MQQFNFRMRGRPNERSTRTDLEHLLGGQSHESLARRTALRQTNQ